ncbi:fatty acid desaturase [Oleomonas cavernae]|nr:fatty acid desaturase [Oleomonas cavernae]
MAPDSGSPPAASARSVSGISRAKEKQIAKALSPIVAWPTLVLALILPATFATIVALGLGGRAPLWACAAILSVVSYAHYTLVHESVHGNVVAGVPKWAWVNTVVGWVGSLGLGVGWPALLRTHVLHHSYTNTERDPDIFVKGTLVQLLGKWVVQSTLGLVPMGLMRLIYPGPYDRLRGVFSQRDVIQISAVTAVTLALLVASLATGHFLYWLFLWFIPTKVGILFLNIFFQWLPHHPFDRTDRYGNTRISLWAGGTFLTLQQNLHLMHHLWPSVPFYNYARLYRALRPVLIEEGCRIEGLGVGPWRKAKE